MKSGPPNILIAGFLHETNTFANTKATLNDFNTRNGNTELVLGEQVLELQDVNVSIGGFIRKAKEFQWDLTPVLWASACPSAEVLEDAYEHIVGRITDAVKSSKFDAVYLDLHGAMVAESTSDGEGTLLQRIRDIVGPGVPVVASLDLHANTTKLMLDSASALIAFRTYPHVDMAVTGGRCAEMLRYLLDGNTLHTRSREIPFLIPINAMCTLAQPAQGVYEALGRMETADIVSSSFTPCFPAADFDGCRPLIWVHARSAAAADAWVDEFENVVSSIEDQWRISFLSAEEAVAEAMQLSTQAGVDKPVIIADTQDNPGAGGEGNTTGVLRALIELRAQGALFGQMYDPEFASKAHAAGVGNAFTAKLGTDLYGPAFEATFEVVNLSTDTVRYDGPMRNGMVVDVGRVALVRTGGVLIAVASVKAQTLDRNLFRNAGVDPESMKIIVVKSSVHFRADFQGIASHILVAKSPGPMIADPADLPWRNLAEGIRTSPLGETFKAQALV